MKHKRLLLTGILVFCAALVWGADYEWIGVTNTTWATSTNWAGGVAPVLPIGSGNKLKINPGTHDPPALTGPLIVDELEVTAGILDLGGQTVTVSGDVTGAGTIAGAGADISVNGDWDVTTVTGAPDITFTGAGTITSNGQTFGDISVSGTYTVSGDLISGGSLDASGGNLTLDTTTGNSITGSVSNGTITVSGATSVTVGSGWNSAILGTALTAEFTGSGTISPTGGSFNTVTINASGAYSGPFTVTTELIVSGGSYTSPASRTFPKVTVSGGTFTPGSGNTVSGVLSVSSGALALGANTLSAGSFTGGGGSISSSGGTITVTGGDFTTGTTVLSGSGIAISANGGIAVSGATISGTVSLANAASGNIGFATTGAPLNIAPLSGTTSGNVTVSTGGTLAVPSFTTTGDVSLTGSTVTPGGLSCADLTITGDAAINVAVTAGSVSVSGSATVAAAVTISGAGAQSYGSLTLNTGALVAVASGGMAVTGSVTINDGSLDGSAGPITVGGNWANPGGTWTPGGGKVTMTGAGGGTGINPGTGFGELEISGGAYVVTGALGTSSSNLTVSGGSLTLGGASTVDGNVIISGGTLNGGSYTLEVVGNWTNTGTFTAGTGTVEFTGGGTHDITGNTTFNVLSCTAGGSTLQFAGGSTQTAATCIITGGTGVNRITLTRISGANWTLSATSLSITYCDISYGNSASYVGWAKDAAVSPYNTEGALDTTSNFFSTFTWSTAAAGTSWTTDANWAGGIAPPVSSTTTVITIPAGASNYPVLAAATTVGEVTIASGATLDLAGEDFTAGTVHNSGILRLHGTQAVMSVTAKDNQPLSTVEYYGAATGASEMYGASYRTLLISKTGGTWAAGTGTAITANAVNNPITANGVAITLSRGITATPGSVTLSGPVTLGAPALTISGAGVTLNGTVNGAYGLTVDAGAGAAVLGGVIGTTPLTSLAVTGASININTTGITTSGAQTYNGPVTLGATAVLASTGSGAITLGAVDAATAGGEGLTLTTGGTAVLGTAGGNIALASLAVNSNGVTLSSSTAIVTSSTGTVLLNIASGSVNGSATEITTGTLTLNGGSTFVLTNAGNDITTLASGATNPTTISYTDSGTGGFTIGNVSSNLSATTINLVAGGPVGQFSGSTISATTLNLGGSGAAYTLANAGNDITTLVSGAVAPTAISYTDSGTGGFTIGNVSSNLSATTINLVAGGPVGQFNNSTITATTLNLGGGGITYTLTNAGNNVSTLTTNGTTPGTISYTDSGGFTIGNSTNNYLSAATINLVAGGAVGQNNAATTITATTLNLGGSGAAYTLTSANAVGTLATTTPAPASINLTNTGNTGVTYIGTVAFTGGPFTVIAGGAISTTGTITGTGAATNTGGVVTLRSANNTNITIGGVVSAVERLSLTAGDVGDDTSTGVVNINAGISVTGDVPEGASAAVYVWAANVTGTGGITHVDPGEACFWIDTTPSYAGTVAGTPPRIHTHFRKAGHLVYANGNDPGNGAISDGESSFLSNLVAGREYNYVNSSLISSTPPPYHVPANRNIYIIGVGTHGYEPEFDNSSGSGFIEIRGVYNSPGALDLKPGTGGVRLDNGGFTATGVAAAVTTGNVFSTDGTKLTLRGTNASITAVGIELGGAVDGVSSGVNNLLLDVSGAPGNTISVTGPVGGGVRLGDIEVRSISTAAAAVDFTGAVTAKSYKQTGVGGTGGAGSTRFSSTQNYTGDFSFTGTNLTINGAVQTDSNNTGADGAFSFSGEDFTLNNTLNTGTNAANTVTIANSGTFTKTASGGIFAGGSFTQNGVGPNSIAQNITASSISFDRAVLITGDAAFEAGTGNITFSGPLIGIGSDLALQVNTTSGSITFANAIGSLASTITIAGTSYSAGNHPFGDFVVTGFNVATSGTVSLDITAETFIVFTNTNVNPPTTMTVTGDTSNNGTINASGSVTYGTDPETTPPADADYAMIFRGGYSGSGTLVAAGANTFIGFDPYAAGTMINLSGTTVPTDGWLVFKGAYNQTFNPNGKTLPNVFIYHATNATGVTLSAVSTNQSDGKKLVVYRGKLDTSAGSWRMGAGAVPGGFSGYNGALSLYPGAELLTGNFFNENTTAHTVTHKGTGASFITASGNVELNRSLFTAASPAVYSTLTMNGSGKTLTVRQVTMPEDTTNDVAVGNFIADGTGIKTIASNIRFKGNVTINATATLDAGNHTIYMAGSGAAGSTWTIDGIGTFVHGTSTVEFGEGKDGTITTGRTFTIASTQGRSNWYNLVCHEPRATLEFSPWTNNLYTHRVLNSVDIEPRMANGTTPNIVAGHLILLTRIGGTGPTPPNPDGGVSDYIPPTSPDANFWYFDMNTASAAPRPMYMHFVYIQYSFSKNRIPLPISGSTLIVATPYVYLTAPATIGTYALGDPRSDTDLANPSLPPQAVTTDRSYYNVNWLVDDRFLYGFTEDSDGNGRIDRLRIQAAFDVTDDTSGFRAVVEGYEVTGYARADKFPRSSPLSALEEASMMDIVYILLKEKDYADTGARPVWWIAENTTVKDFMTGSIVIRRPYEDRLKADDNAPPRINYALTVPEAVYTRPGVFTNGDLGEIYVQFSEPVNTTTVPLAVSGIPPAPAPDTIQPINPDRTEFLIPLPSSGTPPVSPYGVSGLLTPPAFTLNKIQDDAEYALDMRSSTLLYAYQYPSPKYPTNWDDFREYIEVRGDPLGGTGFTIVPPSAGPVPETVPRRDAIVGSPGTINTDSGNKNVAGIPSLSHRVTDVLISVPPTAVTDTQYFVWPLWARYGSFPAPSDPLGDTSRPDYGYLDPNFPANDREIIWDFTGKRFLEPLEGAEIIEFQARSGASVPAPAFVYQYNIADRYKARARRDGAGHGSPGLWLPGAFSPPLPTFNNMVPEWYDEALLPSFTWTTSAAPLYTGGFTITDLPVGNTVVEFFFRLSGSPPDLYAGRLDMAPGTAIPPDWYYRVRPFSFGIHGVTRQRSGATILNNVINPTTGERVYLDYELRKSGRVTIQVFTLDGNLVQVLKRETQAAGRYRVAWDGKNNGGRSVARGMYFIRIVAPDIDEIRKVMVVK